MSEILDELFALRDEKYHAFQSHLVPTLDPETMIGVRMPGIRALAKRIRGTDTAAAFMAELPHRYYEENILHGVLIASMTDAGECIRAVEEFLPYVDNWAVCDCIVPKCFRSCPPGLLDKAYEWMTSDRPYTIRFGLGVLMNFYLEDKVFTPEMLEKAAAVRSDNYYVQMGAAWYFATALAKQPVPAMNILDKLDPVTRRMTIRKAVESFRVSEEIKKAVRSEE